MIRRVELQDAKAIAAIYNEYVIHSVVTFVLSLCAKRICVVG